MKAKYYIPTLLLTGSLIALNSCQDLLELEPAQSLSNETALDNEEGVKQTLNGAYDLLSASSFIGGELMRNAELYGGEGEIVWVGTYTAPREIFLRDIIVNNADVEGLWDICYETMNTVNNVLNALDVVEEDKETVQGEALAIRGWCLFELTRNFGQQYEPGMENTQLGVPIILTPTLNFGDNTDVARSTVEECYAQVIDDLTLAESLLPENNDEKINKHMASALLARVYLQKGDYAAARDAADRVISSNDYDLLANFADVFAQDDNTNEDIFSVQISEQDGNNAMNDYWTINDYGGRGDIEIEDAHYNLYDTADVRGDMFFEDAGIRYTSKFNNEFGNLTVIRLAEMYLIRAECNERLGTATGASPVDDYNAVHTRAGLEAAGSVSLDDILFERRLELAFEGLKIWDIKRLHEMIGTMNYNDPKLIYPVPQAEIDINPSLEQNPGY